MCKRCFLCLPTRTVPPNLSDERYPLNNESLLSSCKPADYEPSRNMAIPVQDSKLIAVLTWQKHSYTTATKMQRDCFGYAVAPNRVKSPC